jgi:hypothetical protein
MQGYLFDSCAFTTVFFLFPFILSEKRKYKVQAHFPHLHTHRAFSHAHLPCWMIAPDLEYSSAMRGSECAAGRMHSDVSEGSGVPVHWSPSMHNSGTPGGTNSDAGSPFASHDSAKSPLRAEHSREGSFSGTRASSVSLFYSQVLPQHPLNCLFLCVPVRVYA